MLITPTFLAAITAFTAPARPLPPATWEYQVAIECYDHSLYHNHTVPHGRIQWSSTTVSDSLLMSIDSFPTALTMMCSGGTITISFKTGEITFHNCEPDEAARQFWFNVMRAFPYFRSAVLAGYAADRNQAPTR